MHTPTLDALGYSAYEGERRGAMFGADGERSEGYYLKLARLDVFDLTFRDVEVGAFDLEGCAEQHCDGLLGLDLIKRFHIEIDGPAGQLIVR